MNQLFYLKIIRKIFKQTKTKIKYVILKRCSAIYLITMIRHQALNGIHPLVHQRYLLVPQVYKIPLKT